MEAKMEGKLNEGLKKTEECLAKTETGLAQMEAKMEGLNEGLKKTEEAINKRIQALIDADAEKRTIRISQAKEQQIQQVRKNIAFFNIEGISYWNSDLTRSECMCKLTLLFPNSVSSPEQATAIYVWGPSSESDQVEDFLEAFKKSKHYDSNVFSANITIHSKVNSKAKGIECTFAGVKFSGKPGDLLVEARNGQGLKEVFGSIELKKECPRNDNEIVQLPGQLLLELIGTYDHVRKKE
jgi:hypothetical protein